MNTFAERLNEAMRIRGKTATDIVRGTGIDHASISNWRHGKYEAGQTKLYKLSVFLDVSEAWLMGYDVPMERSTATNEFSAFTYAMHGAESDLTDHDKNILIQMAQTLARANRGNKD